MRKHDLDERLAEVDEAIADQHDKEEFLTRFVSSWDKLNGLRVTVGADDISGSQIAKINLGYLLEGSRWRTNVLQNGGLFAALSHERHALLTPNGFTREDPSIKVATYLRDPVHLPHHELLIERFIAVGDGDQGFNEAACEAYEDEAQIANDGRTSEMEPRLINYPFSPNVSGWRRYQLDSARHYLGRFTKAAGDTLELLLSAACDEELNPEIAADAQAYKATLEEPTNT